MSIENVGLVQECFLKHMCMGGTRMKQNEDTEEEGKKRRVKREGQTVGKKNIPRA